MPVWVRRAGVYDFYDGIGGWRGRWAGCGGAHGLLARGVPPDDAIGSYGGEEQGETALFRALHDTLQSGDVVLGDRFFASALPRRERTLAHASRL